MGSHYRHIEELQHAYARRCTALRQRLEEFAAVPRHEYFYELVYCLLTPQSSAIHAASAIEALKAARVLEQDTNVAGILARREHYIRFHNTKARHLALLKDIYPTVITILTNGSSPLQMRAWLVKNVKGMGWKEASHFLRNIGHRNLAILDRHILKHLKKHGVLRSIPKSLTAKRYLVIEQKFRRFAETVGIPMDELDLLFWSTETGKILK